MRIITIIPNAIAMYMITIMTKLVLGDEIKRNKTGIGAGVKRINTGEIIINIDARLFFEMYSSDAFS